MDAQTRRGGVEVIDSETISQYNPCEDNDYQRIYDYAKSRGLDVEDTQTWMKLCRAFCDINDYYTALDCLEEAGKLGKNLKNINALSAIIWYKLGRYHYTVFYCSRVTDIDPDEFYAWYLKGECYYHIRKYGKATRCLDRALSLRPGDEASMELREEAHRLSQVYPDQSPSYTKKLMEKDANEIVDAILNGTQHVAVFYRKDKIVLNPRKMRHITDASSQAVADRITRLKSRIRELMAQHPEYHQTNYGSMMAYRRNLE